MRRRLNVSYGFLGLDEDIHSCFKWSSSYGIWDTYTHDMKNMSLNSEHAFEFLVNTSKCIARFVTKSFFRSRNKCLDITRHMEMRDPSNRGGRWYHGSEIFKYSWIWSGRQEFDVVRVRISILGIVLENIAICRIPCCIYALTDVNP